MDAPDHLAATAMPRKPYWLTRGLIAAAAALPLTALMALTPLSWWKGSGFESYPGTYVRVSPEDYWLCRPWPRHGAPVPRDASTRMATRFGSLTGTEESNFAVLLPATGRVTAVYCGAGPASSRPSSNLAECSGTHCALPAHFQVDDGLYTLGRGVIFSVRAKAAKPDQRTNVGFWVMWR